MLIVSEDFRTCVPLSRYKPPTNASHTHRPHSLSDAAAGLAAHYFQDVAPEHPLVSVCASVCVSAGVLSNSVSAVKSASVCVSASPKPDRAPVAAVKMALRLGWPAYAVNSTANLPAAIPLGPPCVIALCAGRLEINWYPAANSLALLLWLLLRHAFETPGPLHLPSEPNPLRFYAESHVIGLE